MTRKKLAISKALFSLVAFLGFFLLCAFFFTYGNEAAKELIEKLQSEPVESGQINLSGLGPAVLLVLCIIALISFALPELLFLISFSGNFGKQGSTIGFTVVSLVAEVFAGVILTFFTACFIEGTGYDLAAIIVTGVYDAFIFASFIQSIVVLASHKKAKEE